MNEENPVLYILMRRDLKSMNPGKAMAQASHASNAFVKHANDEIASFAGDAERHSEWRDLFEQWQNSTPQGFGTVLVLGVNQDAMRVAVGVAGQLGYISGIVTDPTYPYIVGNEEAALISKDHDSADRIYKPDSTVLFRREDTCGYIFMDKNDATGQKIVSDFNLHP